MSETLRLHLFATFTLDIMTITTFAFSVASLLSCLYQLRSENVRLEEHVNNLIARRDHLLAVNARLAIPLSQTAGGQPTGGGEFILTNPKQKTHHSTNQYSNY